jgi:Sulfotransferase family
MRASSRPVKVLFIAGWSRSGTTFLDTLLGEIDGFFSTGELRAIWDAGLQRRWSCGCGAPVPECPVWSSVLTAAYGDARNSPAAHPERIWRHQQEAVRMRHLPRLLGYRQGSRPRWEPLAAYLDAVGPLYRAIAEVTEARVIVDSSKLAQEAAVLRLVSGIRPYLVHLVRDPRGVARSMQRQMLMQGSNAEAVEMPRSSAAASSLGWLRTNAAIEAVRRRYPPTSTLKLRYEDLAREPHRSLAEIASLVGEPLAGPGSLEDMAVELHGNHTVWGNPGRFRTGRVEIKYDDGWTKELGVTDRRVSTVASLPLLARYGYPIRLDRDSGTARHG